MSDLGFNTVMLIWQNVSLICVSMLWEIKSLFAFPKILLLLTLPIEYYRNYSFIYSVIPFGIKKEHSQHLVLGVYKAS